MAASIPVNIYDLVYSTRFTPAGCRRREQWLRDGYRVVGEKSAQILRLHDRPRSRRRNPDEPLPPEEIDSG